MGIESVSDSSGEVPDRRTATFPDRPDWLFWLHAAAAGLIAGQVFAVWFQFTIGTMPALGTVFPLGEPSVSFAWGIHVVTSALFGVLYAVVVDSDAVRPYASTSTRGVLVGAVFGALLWFLLNVVFWPFWATMFADWPAIGSAAVMGPATAHILWGELLGGLFPQLRRIQ